MVPSTLYLEWVVFSDHCLSNTRCTLVIQNIKDRLKNFDLITFTILNPKHFLFISI